jgi:hypothetical protein
MGREGTPTVGKGRPEPEGRVVRVFACRRDRPHPFGARL